MVLTRSDLQELTRTRLRDARVLLKAGCYDGAYYLTGYAVECALKACIAKTTKRHDFPDKRIVNDSYTHDIEKLLRTAGLQSILNEENVVRNWAIVKDWNEGSRYQFKGAKDARGLYLAVTSRRYGVLTWIRKFW